ncbi:conserved Plasmodium protein, unknown function [Plasmodium vivax]|uniref:Uncharacterized protein n=1 Tax=Plasmodium vivax TaxID=5855 RepID=A0A565A230_PLAVI|nr:conserved Plasmodium protein, unknown function [Plasmodium vivax]
MRWLVIFLSTAIVLVSTLLIVLLLKKPLQVGRTFVWSNCVVFSLSISTKKLTISEILVDIKCKKKTLQVHLNDVKFVFAKWSIRCQVGNFFLHGTCENGKKEERKKKAVFFSDPSKKGKKSSDDASNRGKKLLFCVAKLFLFMLSLIDVHIERCHLLLQKSMQQGGKQCADENETTEEKRDRQKDSTDGATKQRRKENFITAAIEAVLSNVHITKNRKIETISSFFDLEKISIFCNDRSACTISSGSFRTCYDHQLRSVSVEGVFILRIYFYLNCLYELVFFFFSTNNVYCEGGSKKWKTSPQLCNRLGNFINRVTLHMEMVKLYMKEKDTTPFLCILTDDLSLEKEGTPNLVRSRVKRLHLLSVEGGRCYVSTAYDVSACVEVGPSGRSGNNGSDLSAFTQGGSTHGEVARPTNNFTSADAKLKIQIDCEKLFMNLCSVWPLIYFNFVKNFFDLFQVAKEKDRSAKLPRREGQDGRYKGGATPNGGEDNEGATYPHNANSSDERKKGKCKMKGEKERSAANKKNFTLNLCANDICCKFRNSGNLVVIDLDPLDEGFAKTFVLTSNRFNLHLEKRSFLLALKNVEVFNSNGRFTCLVHNFTICKTHREYFFEAKNVFFYFPPMELLTVGVVNFALECLREASHSTFLRAHQRKSRRRARKLTVSILHLRAESNRAQVLCATLKIVVSKNVVYVISEQTTLCGRNFTLACDYLNVCNEKKESNFTFIRLDTPTVSSTFDDHFLELLNEVHRVVRFISILVKRTKGGGNPVGENLHSAAGPEGKVKPQANRKIPLKIHLKIHLKVEHLTVVEMTKGEGKKAKRCMSDVTMCKKRVWKEKHVGRDKGESRTRLRIFPSRRHTHLGYLKNTTMCRSKGPWRSGMPSWGKRESGLSFVKGKRLIGNSALLEVPNWGYPQIGGSYKKGPPLCRVLPIDESILSERRPPCGSPPCSHGFASNWAKGGNAQDVTDSAKVKGNTKGNFRRRRRNHRGYINRGDSTPKERRRKCRGRGKLLSNQTHPPRMYRCTHLRWCSQRKKSPTGEKAKRMFMQKKGLVKGLLLIDGVDVHKEEDMGMAQLDKTYAFLFKNISEFKLPHFLRTLEFIRAQKEDQFFTLNYLMPHVWEEIAFCFFTDRIHMLRETQTASSSLSLSRSKVLFAGANLNIAVAYVMRKMSFCREERTHVMWLEKGGNRKKENIDDGGNVSSGAASVSTANPSRTVIHCTFVELHFFSEYVCTFTLSCRSLSVVMQRRGEEGGRYPFADVTARNFLLAYGFFSNGKVGNSLFTQKENAYVCRRIFRKLQLRERILRLSIGETNRVKELLYVAYARGQAFSRGGKGDPAEDETEPACCVPNVRYLTLNITLVGKTEEEGVINCNILPHQILFLLNMMRKANSCGDSLSSGLRNFFKSSPKEQRNMRGIPGEKNRMNVKLNLEATNLHLKFYFLRLFLKRVTLNSCEGEGLVHLFGKKRGHPRSSTSKTADDTICSFSIDSFVLSFEDAVDSSFSKREGFIFMNDVRNFPPSIFFHLFGRMPPLYCPIASNVLRHLEVRRMEVLIKRKERTFVSIDSVTMYINDQTIERLNFVFEKGRKIFSLLSGSWGGPLGRDQNSSHCNRERSSICYLKNFEINFHKMVEVKNRKSRNSNGGKKEKKKNNFLLEDSFICASEKVQGKDHPRQDGSHTGVNPVEEGKKKLSNYLFERKIHFLKRRGGEAAKRATKDREECGTDLCTEGIPPTEQREARPTQREDPLLDVHTKMLQRLRRLRRLRGLRSDPNGETPGKFHYYNRMIHPFYFLPAQSSAAPCSYAERYEDVCKNVPFNYVECEDQLLLFLHKTIIKYMNSSGEQSVSFFLKSLSSYYISSHHLFSINKHRGRKGGGGSNGGYTIHNRVKENMTCAGENNLSNELMIANLHERETYERLERKRRRKKKSTHLEEVKTNGEEKKRKRAVPYDNASLPPARNEKHFCSNKSTAKMEGSNQSTFEFASSSHSNDESVKGKWKSASHDNVSKVNELRKKMKLFFCLPNKNETLSPFLRAKELNVVMRSHRGGKQRIDSSIGGSGSEGGEANPQGNEVGGVGEVGEVSVYLDYLILLFNKRVVDYFFYLTSKMVKYYEGRRGGVSNEDGLPPGGGSGRNGRQRISSKNVLSLAESYSQFLCSRSNFKKCTIVDDLKNGYSFNFAMNTIAVEFITRDYTSYVIFLRGVHVFLKKEEMTSLGVNVNDFCLEKIKNLNHVKVISVDKDSQNAAPNWVNGRKIFTFPINGQNDANNLSSVFSLRLKFFKIFLFQEWNVVQKLRINLCDVNLRIDRSTMQDFSLLKRFLAKKRKEKKKSEKGEREKKRGTKYSSYLYVHLLEVSPLLIKANIQGSHEMNVKLNINQFREEKKMTYLKKTLKKYKRHILKSVGGALITRRFLDFLKWGKTNSRRAKDTAAEK